MQCCGLLAILIAAAILFGPTVGLSFLYTREREKTVQVCNTKSYAFQVYSKSEVVLMKDVCMTVPQPEVTNWNLFTASCNRDVEQDTYSFTIDVNASSVQEILFYRFYMVGASYIEVIDNYYDGTNFKYQKTDSAEKASTYNKFTCAADGQTLSESGEPFEKANHPGYYVILCIIPYEDDGTYYYGCTLSVTEFYYTTAGSTNDCTDLEHNGAERCCRFSNPSSQHNCVYLSHDPSLPDNALIPVDVKITYADSVKTLLIVAVCLTVIVAAVVLALIYFVQVRWRR